MGGKLGMGSSYHMIVCLTAALGGLLFGYEVGLIGESLSENAGGFFSKLLSFSSLAADPSSNTSDADNFDALAGNVTLPFFSGCVFGTLLATCLADWIGRKYTMVVGSLFYTIGQAGQALSHQSSIFYTGRCIAGSGIGMLSLVVPLYISEIARTRIRGRMISVTYCMTAFGVLTATLIQVYVISPAFRSNSDLQWRVSLSIPAGLGLLVALLMSLLPRSPRWLIHRKHESQSLMILGKLENASPDSEIVQQEYKSMLSSSEHESRSHKSTTSWRRLFQRGMWSRILIVMLLHMCQQFTGINMILYFQKELIQRMGFNSEDAFATPLTLINDSVNFLATLCGLWGMDDFGRRKMLIFGSMMMGLAHLLVFAFLLGSAVIPKLAWGAIFSMSLFLLAYGSTWGPIPHIYPAEIFPFGIRAKAYGLSILVNWLTNALLGKYVPLLLTKIGGYTYLINASLCFIMAAFTLGFIPETMGMSLEDMDPIFGYEDEFFEDDQEMTVDVEKK